MSPVSLPPAAAVAPPVGDWRTPALWLMIAQAAMQLSFAAWWALLNNFAVEQVGATGEIMGWQQSIRELPGLLAFTAVLWLVLIREQNLALLALLLQGIGIAMTGYFPSIYGFFLTTLIMSIGFHYYETMNQSLALQWLDKKTAPITMGKIVSVGAFAQLAAYLGVFAAFKGAALLGFSTGAIGYDTAFLVAGLFTIGATLLLAFVFPRYTPAVVQSKKLVIRKRYWLYYALTMMQGARRQIFTVFAGFMLVQVFKFSVADMALLFLVNCVFNMVIAPQLGRLIAHFGERWSLTAENMLLVLVFGGYAAIVTAATLSPGDTETLRIVAAVLFVVDGVSITLGIAIKTYFQKIGDPADMASQAGVAFSINHVAAVFIPVVLGMIWIIWPGAVFIIGACFAVTSLVLARFVPRHPEAGGETVFSPARPAPAE